MKKALLFALLLTMTACAYVDPSITDQTKVYYDSPVRKSPLQVSIHPKGKQFRPLTAYFHPFVIQQENSDYAHLSDAFAQIFLNAWTEERLFPIMEYQPGTPYRGLRMALDTARRRGADVLILGKIPYFYAGHTLDDTAITIQLDIYAAGSGDLIWTMMQSGRIEEKMPDDYIYFRHEYRLSEAPFNKIIRAMAKDMAIPLAAWLPDPDTKFEFAETSAEVTAQLAPSSAMAKKMQGDSGMKTTTMSEEPLGEDTEPVVVDTGDTPGRPSVNGVNLDILFDFDKATIKAESFKLLDALGEAMSSQELKGRRIIIAGHTDSRGDKAYNLTLSKKRAEAVKAYLVNKWKVNPDTVETVGYGMSRPMNKGNTPEERQKNRRVEIRLAE